ncbi:hypothetical protein OB905_13090 [Halobacteria archaeon AArc-dxtr1]|nr:hypothetical protein [Halobacteria archaeon AArc-dxtr1]
MSSDVIARWSEYPFTSYDRRSNEIEHRVVIEHYGGACADVRHEVQSVDDDSVPAEWTEHDVIEIREHGLQKISGRVEVLRS